MASSVLGFLMIFLLLILPIAIGIALILTSRRGGLGFPACGACQYDLSGTVGSSERCPECGALYVKVGILPPHGPKKTIRMWTGIAMLAVPLTCFGLAVIPLISYTNQAAMRARAAAAQAQQAALAAQQQAQQQQGQEQQAQDARQQSTDAPPPDADPSTVDE